MENIIDSIVLLSNNATIKIGSVDVCFYRELIIDKKKYAHFSGKILLDKNKISQELNNLLFIQEELINEGAFIPADAVRDQINCLEIFLEKSHKKVYDLYVENVAGDFKIII